MMELLRNSRFLIGAHRGGAALRPENTMAAFEHALTLGVDYIECDTWLTRDGKAIIHHDPTMTRTAGVELFIPDTNYDELKDLDIGSHFAPEFAAERLTLLDDLLAWGKGRARFSLEIKYAMCSPPLIAQTVAALIKKHDYYRDIYVMSFNHRLVKMVKEIDPAITTAIIAGDIPVDALDSLKKAKADIYNSAWRDMSPEVFAEITAAGYLCSGGMANLPYAWEAMTSLGARNMESDIPDRLMEFARQKGLR